MEQRGAGNSLKWLGLSVLILGLDLATKAWALSALNYAEAVKILPILNFTLLYNPGAAFSFLADQGGWQRWFFILLSGAVSIGLVVWLARLPAHNKMLAASLSLVLGGAIGNVFDRVWHGYVIDFISFHWNDAYFPAFNIADSAITVGAVLLILDALFEQKKTSAPS